MTREEATAMTEEAAVLLLRLDQMHHFKGDGISRDYMDIGRYCESCENRLNHSKIGLDISGITGCVKSTGAL